MNQINNTVYVITKTVQRFDAYLKILEFTGQVVPINTPNYRFVFTVRDLKLLQKFTVILLNDHKSHPDWQKINLILNRSGASVFNAKF